MGRWDQDKRPDDELLGEFRDLQLRLLHCKDRRKNAVGKYAVEKIDSKIKESYQELRELYEGNRNRFYDVINWQESNGFECFAWYLMLSEDTQKRFR